MKTISIRLHQGDDLLLSIKKICKENNIKAGVILSSVGSISQLCIRDATGVRVQTIHKEFEIISLNGTLSINRVHLHLACSDDDLNVFGGHLQENTIINTTCELVILILDETIFDKEFDTQTGYSELKICNKKM